MNHKYIFLPFLILLVLLFASCKDTVSNPESNNSISVLSPKNGDTLNVASSFTISWTSNSKSNVRIEFSTDNGVTWTLIADSVANNGAYFWYPVPNMVTAQGKIRITTVDNLAKDVSPGLFNIIKTVSKALVLTKPSGGEVLYINQSFRVEWVSSNIVNIKIEFSIDNGTTWNPVVLTYPADSSFYLWNPIPNFPSTQCLLKITDISDVTITDKSKSVFSIVIPQDIKVISPNGGEIWNGNTSQAITWYSSGISNVKIEYTRDNGVNWTTIINSTPSVGFYQWNALPNDAANNTRIRISDAEDGFPADISDSVFTIAPQPALILISPNGGEDWMSGTSQTIRWNSLGKTILGGNASIKLKSSPYFPQTIANIKIEYTVNNGSEWKVITQSTPNNGSFLWASVPSENSSLCRVRISDADAGVPFAISDNTFRISNNASATEITVVFPNGGESLQAGSNMNIAWTSTNVQNVKIELTTNGGADWSSIIASTPSIGQYLWKNIPVINSSLCRIKISNADGTGQPYDISNNNFTIGGKILNWVFPNGGESIISDTLITWTSTAINSVNIEYTIDNGQHWILLASNRQSTGAYNWKIPQGLPSTLARLRITDSSDPTITDMSDDYFYLTGPGKLVSPNGNKIIKK